MKRFLFVLQIAAPQSRSKKHSYFFDLVLILSFYLFDIKARYLHSLDIEYVPLTNVVISLYLSDYET
jgi:hypothetical protein